MAAPTMNHFAHPDHELKLRDDYHITHSCDLCGEDLDATGYSCPRHLCGFNLHEECATYPETLTSFFVHPWHDLTLSPAAAACGGGAGVICHVCREEVPADDEVFLYRCAPCGFAMHPRCSRLPRQVRSELHPEHSLDAVAGMGTCAACGKPCYVWVYRCGLCNVDLHIDCLHGAKPTSNGGGTGAGGQPGSAQLVGTIAQVGAFTLMNMLDKDNN